MKIILMTKINYEGSHSSNIEEESVFKMNIITEELLKIHFLLEGLVYEL